MGHRSGIGVERHYYRPGSIAGEFSLIELNVKKAVPFLTISEENRLKLKNMDLEIRMQANSNRIKEAEQQIRKELEQRDLRGYETIAALGDRIADMEKEIRELRKSRQEKNKE